MEQEKVTAESYTLYTESGSWLGQVVLTSDGMFASVTDYGNFSFAWRHWGKDDFRQFLSGLDVGYFATKMYCGMSYVAHGKKIDQACERFAKEILPPLQKLLRKELKTKPETVQYMEELKIGDKVRVMDQGLLMLQKFAPPGAKPNNEGILSEIMEDGYVEVEFPIGNDDPKDHSQVAPYPASICVKIKD